MAIQGSTTYYAPAPYEPQLDYSFQNFLPVVPSINNRPQTLPGTWPPPGFFTSNPARQGIFNPTFPAISPTPLKNDAQLDQERREILQGMNPLPSGSSLLWIAAIGAAVYYFYKKGKA